MDFFTELRFRDSSVTVNSIVVHRDDGSFMLVVAGQRPAHDVNEEGTLLLALQQRGISMLELTAAEIRIEPRLSNAREIWAYQDYRVPMGDRMRILQALDEDGPQSIVALQDIAPTSTDLASALCALACADLVEIEIDEMPIGPATVIRSRH